MTPFSVTSKHLDAIRYWHNDPVIYVFDPKKTTDLLDLWNLRIEPSRVYPIPVAWFHKLIDSTKKFIERNHRPVKGNNNGVMHSTTIEIARSISEEQARDNFIPLLKGLPNGSWSFKLWRTSIWSVDYSSKGVMHPEKIKLSASEKREDLAAKDDGFFSTKFESLSPVFAEQHSSSRCRWANVLSMSAYGLGDCNVALSLPYNTFDKNWPNVFHGKFNIGREGWVYCQDHKDSSQMVELLKMMRLLSAILI